MAASKPIPISQAILATFDRSLASGHVRFSPSTVHTIATPIGVNFQVRLVTALSSKPEGYGNPASISIPSEKPEKLRSDVCSRPRSPFLPFEPAMYVTAFDHHNVLLNKFSVVRGHVLLTTKEFESQFNPLDGADLSTTWKILHNDRTFISDYPDITVGSTEKHPQAITYLCFYNCGHVSGASVPHKHLQFLPIEDQPPIASLFLSEAAKAKYQQGVPHTHSALPFAHSFMLLPPNVNPLNLESLYRSLVAHAFSSAGISPAKCLEVQTHPMLVEGLPAVEEDINPPSYNFVMTKEFMFCVPRRFERALDLSVNSVGFAGMLLCKTEQQLEVLRLDVGERIWDVLKGCAFEKTAST
ncbi:ATP adenylyltransferase-domain-containing protein [Gaertneriomyces semiglobifer]|nr:ATP adenylyltransferase-domain-containing protein [Gaertneriomyces semiglobifer]